MKIEPIFAEDPPERADGIFLLTGGGIKLTRTMQEDPLLVVELSRIERIKKFLKAEGIDYIDDYFLSNST